jgi:hypothetical protein
MKEYKVQVKMFGFVRSYTIMALSENEAANVAITLMSAALGID